jgi:hypothetical protein
MMELWSVGVLECWSYEVLDAGVRERKSEGVIGRMRRKRWRGKAVGMGRREASMDHELSYLSRRETRLSG